IWLPGDFYIGMDEEIQGRPLLWRLQVDVAAGGEANAVFGQVAEVIVLQIRIAVRLGDIDGDPAALVGVEPSPAMVSADGALAVLSWDREAHLELGRDLVASRHRDEQAMKIGTVAKLAVTGPD